MPYDNSRMRREIGRHLRELGRQGLTQRYITTQRSVLLRFREHCRAHRVNSVGQVQAELVLSFLRSNRGSSLSYQRSQASAVRVFLDAFENSAMKKLRLKYSGVSRVHVDWLSLEETSTIMSTPMNPRETILIGAGLLQGMRRIETLRMTVRDAQDAVSLGVLRIRGKGGKERAVPVHPIFKNLIDGFLRQRVTGEETEAVLGFGRTRSEEILGGFCERFGRKVTFHTLRRTFGRNLWLSGVRLETVSELLGHSSTDMTRLYLGLNLSDMRAALGSYVLPEPVVVISSRNLPELKENIR